MACCRSLQGRRGLLVCLLVVSLCRALSLHAETPGNPGGIQRLTEEAHEEAIQCGQSGADCAIQPYRLCPSQDPGHTAWIATPFSRVASSVFEFLQRHERVRPMSPGVANGWGVGIYVSPAGDFDRADSIHRVVIRRGTETIQPITTTIAPVVLTSRGNLKKQVSKGFFAFPMNAFAPSADISIVLTGSLGESVCTLDRRTLAALR